ncbi:MULTISPECIES: restriction endonuclease subunit S [Clostridia]|uniref:restriction endonuclease subunit S n=1 Tax=Clostridium innocuum TaxID=1522 RepID=UPI001897E366|nr:restriction endonuclease subunit S [[Clostridium] innocuum]
MNRMKLGEILSVKHGWAFKGEYFAEDGEQSILTPGNFFEKGGFKPNNGKERYYTGTYPKEYLCHKGDLIVAMTQQAEGLLGSTALVPENNKYLHNQRIGLITCDEKRLNKLFAYYLFMTKSVREQLERSSSGTKVKHTSPEKIYDVEVEIPDVISQQKIANLLWAIDEKIANNNAINDNLEQQAKLIYDYWFTQFDFPDENGKPYCSSGGKMVWNEQLKRNIPENWKVAQLKDIFNVSGKPISRDDCQTDAYYTPIDVIPKRTITFAGGLSAAEANSSLQVYEENNILLGAMRVYFHRVCISAQSGITRTTTLVLKPKVDEYLGYAYQVLNDDNAILYATQHSSGTQQPYIKWNDVLENYRFAMPSNPKLLYEYSKISEPLITKAKNCARETEQLRKLRDWLLPMLMNGQATIND